ncbi:hypothetical protein PLIIFM63780_007452 [Purpureocillium lilacinum]|nr:hypothetical protein PLIIFM63780_007452 [Purpureocillium lilacinum]
MEQLNAILDAHVAPADDTRDKLLGAAFVVVSKDGPLYAGSAGRIGFDPQSAPFSRNSFTYVASLTKLITTTCLMQLVERGVLSLDGDVRGYAPELAAMKILRGFHDADQPILEENTAPITLRQV